MKRRKRLIKISVFFVVLSVLCLLHVKYNVRPVMRTVSEEAVRVMTTEAVNEAASIVMCQTVGYTDIIKTEKNAEGDIVLITADPLTVNELARGVVLLVQSRIQQAGEQGISIPIGTMSGITFLSGKGKSIRFKALPVGTASTTFVSDFKSMGINQTLHRISLQVSAEVTLVVPGMDIDVRTVTEIVIAESVIVGKVPDTYLHSGTLDEMLNLVP